MASQRGRARRTAFAACVGAAATLPLLGACTVVDGLRVPGAATSAPSFGDASARADGELASDGSSSSSVGDAAAAGNGDGGGSFDAAVEDALSLCPLTPCGSGEACCYVSKSATSGAYRCMAGCPGGAAPVECAGPQQCASGMNCCATVTLGPGTVPNCPAVAMSSACVGRCDTNIGLGCNVTDTFRLCHVGADCASDSQNPYCCTYAGSGLSSLICVSGLVRDALNLPCAP